MEVVMEQIVPIILILVGLLFIVIGLILSLRAKAAAKWPSTQGIITKSELAEHVIKNRTQSNKLSTYTSYEPVFEYDYEVNGAFLKGKKYAMGLTRLPLDQAQVVVDKFPLEARVPVYYDPKNPKESRLQVAAAGATPQLVLGIVIAVIGLVWLVVTLL